MSDTMTMPDGFSLMSLTQSINALPYSPGLCGQLFSWEPQPVATLTVAVEVMRHRLALIGSSVRGAPPPLDVSDRRTLVNYNLPTMKLGSAILADSVQDVREFGSASSTMSFEAERTRRMKSLNDKWSITEEWLRFGCLNGTIVLRTNRDTGLPEVTVPIWPIWGMAQLPPIPFPIGPFGDPLNGDVVWEGNLTNAINFTIRSIEDTLETDVPGFAVLAGANFFDAFLRHPECRDAYKVWASDQESFDAVRGRSARRPFRFRGLTIYEYRARVSITNDPQFMNFIDPDQAIIAPLGIPGLLTEAMGPADWVDTVGTRGLPVYLRAWPMQMSRGFNMELQAVRLPMCTQPYAIRKLIMQPSP